MGKFEHKEVRELADYVRAHRKKTYDLEEGIKAEKAIAMKVLKSRGNINGP